MTGQSLEGKAGDHGESEGGGLPRSIADNWSAAGFPGPGSRVAVACSGGLDSLALLHALRFQCSDLNIDLSVAHFDHRMRPGSAGDAAWVAGVAGAWRLALHRGIADEVPRGEEAARRARYRFLESLLEADLVDAVATAHHADDQVETVLFRLARGTGIEGLKGIPSVRAPGVFRPLLPFSRAEIEAYADAMRLRPRHDPTNHALRYARNRLRHRALPELEAVHPGAREGILRIARIADRTVGALEELVRPHLTMVTLARTPGSVVLSRDALLERSPAVRGEILRAAARQVGTVLSEAATNLAVSFVSDASSGAWIPLPGGIRLARSFDHLRLAAETPLNEGATDAPDRIAIEHVAGGRGRVRLGASVYDVRWRPIEPDRPESPYAGSEVSGTRDSDLLGGWVSAELPQRGLPFPLSLRGWEPGDRVRTAGGRRRVKRVFAEARIPREVRGSVPVLVGSDGLVIWIAVPSIARVEVHGTDRTWQVGVRSVEGPGLCWGG